MDAEEKQDDPQIESFKSFRIAMGDLAVARRAGGLWQRSIVPVVPVVLEEGVVIAAAADIAACGKGEVLRTSLTATCRSFGSSLVALTGLEGLRRVEGSVEIWFTTTWKA